MFAPYAHKRRAVMVPVPEQTHILATKLFAPPTRPEFVQRPRLQDSLQQLTWKKLILISAPAGFGKTALVSDWLHNAEIPSAWLSLHASDGELSRFLSYVIAALQTIKPDIGEDVLPLLAGPSLPPVPSLMTTLLNTLSSVSEHFVLVLDDYHVLEVPAIDEALQFLLGHMPPTMHLVMLTREDPPFPLGRLRVKGELLELRAADLRFTIEESSSFLRERMGISLSDEQLTSLESRTEGWIAGLQLAALSMRGKSDLSSFITDFSGEHRYVVDYLVEEVIRELPTETRDFLLRSSILQRLGSGLCDAVVGVEGSLHKLEELEKSNLFVIPLDEKRHWFRFHHLFADVLHAHAKREYPDEIRVWHQRAATWYASEGMYEDAIEHAREAKDCDRLAAYLECCWPEMDGLFQSGTWRRWASSLPEECAFDRPILCLAYGWSSLSAGDMENGAIWLRRADECFTEEGGLREGMIVVDERQRPVLMGSLCNAWAYRAKALGRNEEVIEYAQKALKSLPEDALIHRGPASSLLGMGFWEDGQLEAAYDILFETMASFRQAGNLHFALSVTYGLAELRWAQGRLHDAMALFERSLEIAQAELDTTLKGLSDLYLGMSDIQREQGLLTEAKETLEKSEELGEGASLDNWLWRFRVSQARLHMFHKEWKQALAFFDKAERAYFSSPVPFLRPFDVWCARVWFLSGDWEAFDAWGEKTLAQVEDEVSYLHEWRLLMLSLYQASSVHRGHAGDMESVHQRLQGLLEFAERQNRMGSVIEILLVQACVWLWDGQRERANAALSRALSCAAPQGYVQCFLDAGEDVIGLLREGECVADEASQEHRVRVLAACGEEVEQTTLSTLPVKQQTSAPVQPLVEPLSKRELEVLGLIAEGLSNDEIGKQLFIAISTIKGHNRNIFGKLGVRRRTEAVARARELGIL
ncbi:MAG: helix-turn-helix transcriptional regulator [Deltaproteobacteria bacterium]|nr:helix-turn-helix transcriptional regulator [Deltaproteobacteria bacterium]